MYHKESTDYLSAETTSQLFEKDTSNVTLIGASSFPTTDRAVIVLSTEKHTPATPPWQNKCLEITG